MAVENMGFSHKYPQDSQQQLNQVTLSGVPSSSSLSSSSSFSAMEFFLISELEKYRAEVDSFLKFQNERSSLVFREETRQRGVVLQKYASELMSLIRQKESELAMAHSRTVELQEHLTRSNIESKAWQSKAIENESMVVNLTNKINEVNEKMLNSNAAQDDQESNCGSSSVIKNNNCTVCHAMISCVIFFPCRHLCCCRTCEGLLEFCPVCETVKEQSMEIFLV